MDNSFHFKRFVRIAKNANTITPDSFDIIFNIGLFNGIDEDKIGHILAKKTKKIILENIDPWKRFKFFYSLVQLMRLELPQYTRELNFCIDLAAWLGYDPVFLNKLISGIFHNENTPIPVEANIMHPSAVIESTPRQYQEIHSQFK
ncbi:MAG TPA: hypothetical protein VI583_18410 [Cyclobacteriaceae bacterium]|nr:hypothetical protein [Cyclobacteriaceae bacterium]